MNLYRRLSSRLGGSHMRFHRADLEVGGTGEVHGKQCRGLQLRDGLQNSDPRGLPRRTKVASPPPREPIDCSPCRLGRCVPRLHLALFSHAGRSGTLRDATHRTHGGLRGFVACTTAHCRQARAIAAGQPCRRTRLFNPVSRERWAIWRKPVRGVVHVRRERNESAFESCVCCTWSWGSSGALDSPRRWPS